MRFLSKIAACSLLLFGMVACKSDEPAGGGDNGAVTGDPFYSIVTITNPAQRSGGANEGEEVGQDYENKISSILVILATKDETEEKYKFLTSAHSETAISLRNLQPYSGNQQESQRNPESCRRYCKRSDGSRYRIP